MSSLLPGPSRLDREVPTFHVAEVPQPLAEGFEQPLHPRVGGGGGRDEADPSDLHRRLRPHERRGDEQGPTEQHEDGASPGNHAATLP